MKAEQQELFAELVRGAELILANAEQLIEEARLLRDNNRLSRSVFLNQIAMEECAKIDIVGTAATQLLRGHAPDLKEMTKSIRDHKEKNFTNAYVAKAQEAELAAREANDYKAAKAAFKAMQADIHTFLNTAKNSSMYVDFAEGRFVSPDDVVTKELADQIAAVSTYFTSSAGPKIRLLRRMVNEPDVITEWMKGFDKTLLSLSGQGLSVNEQTKAIVAYIHEHVDSFAGRKK